MASVASPTQEIADFLPDHSYLFSKTGLGRRISADTGIEWLKRRDAADGEFVWLHFHDVPKALAGLPSQLADLSADFGDMLREGSRSTRIEQAHQNLIAIVNDVDYDFTHKGWFEVATLWLSVGARCLVSVRVQPLRSVDQLRRDVEAGGIFHSPMALVIRLFQEQADALYSIAHEAGRTANNVEDALLTQRLPKSSGLGHIRRDLVRLRRLLAPEPAALFRLVNRPPHWIREEDVQALRQSAEAFSLALRGMTDLQEHIKLLEEEIAGKVAEHTNRSVLILASVTVLALPVNMITGLLGMSVGGIPFRDDVWGFWIVFVLALALTGLAAWFLFRHRGEAARR